jgi:hypothetical protein
MAETEKWSNKRDKFADSVWRIATSDNKAARNSSQMKFKIRGMVKWSDKYLQNTARSKKVPFEMAKAARTILANRSNSNNNKMRNAMTPARRPKMDSINNPNSPIRAFGQGSAIPVNWTAKKVNEIYSEVLSQRKNFTFKPKETMNDWQVVMKFNKSSLRRMNSIPKSMRGPKHNAVVGQLKGQLTKVTKALR